MSSAAACVPCLFPHPLLPLSLLSHSLWGSMSDRAVLWNLFLAFCRSEDRKAREHVHSAEMAKMQHSAA